MIANGVSLKGSDLQKYFLKSSLINCDSVPSPCDFTQDGFVFYSFDSTFKILTGLTEFVVSAGAQDDKNKQSQATMAALLLKK